MTKLGSSSPLAVKVAWLFIRALSIRLKTFGRTKGLVGAIIHLWKDKGDCQEVRHLMRYFYIQVQDNLPHYRSILNRWELLNYQSRTSQTTPQDSQQAIRSSESQIPKSQTPILKYRSDAPTQAMTSQKKLGTKQESQPSGQVNNIQVQDTHMEDQEEYKSWKDLLSLSQQSNTQQQPRQNTNLVEEFKQPTNRDMTPERRKNKKRTTPDKVEDLPNKSKRSPQKDSKKKPVVSKIADFFKPKRNLEQQHEGGEQEPQSNIGQQIYQIGKYIFTKKRDNQIDHQGTTVKTQSRTQDSLQVVSSLQLQITSEDRTNEQQLSQKFKQSLPSIKGENKDWQEQSSKRSKKYESSEEEYWESDDSDEDNSGEETKEIMRQNDSNQHKIKVLSQPMRGLQTNFPQRPYSSVNNGIRLPNMVVVDSQREMREEKSDKSEANIREVEVDDLDSDSSEEYRQFKKMLKMI